MNAAAGLPDQATTARWATRHLTAIAAFLVIGPVLLSFVAWLAPPHPSGVTGFLTRAPLDWRGALIVVPWLLGVILAAAIGLAAARRRGPIQSLRYVSLHGFHVAAVLIGSLGTVWVYWSVTGGSWSQLVQIWHNQSFTLFRNDFQYGVGVSTGRYASALAGGLSIAHLLQGRRMRVLDLASLVLLGAAVLLNSRLAALMAISVALAVLLFSPGRPRVRVLGTVMAAVLVVALFVAANYSRNGRAYSALGISNPITMTLLNAQAYLAVPTQVTVGVFGAAADDRALPPTSLRGTLDPLLPPYVSKPLFGAAGDGDTIWQRYQGEVELTREYTTNGAAVDLMMQSGWGALIMALGVIGVACWIAGRFLLSGPIGAAVGGAILYGLAETWRVFMFNTGLMHFVALMGLGAVAVGWLRSTRPIGRGASARPPAPPPPAVAPR